MKKFSYAFYRRDAETLARDLIGAVLVHRRRGREYQARIVETEAYVGPHDLASHSSKGRTKRTEVMFGPAGHAYVYLIYGMHEMFNIVSGKRNSGQADLVRFAEPLDGWQVNLSGPGGSRAAWVSRARQRDGLDRRYALYIAGLRCQTPDQEIHEDRRGICGEMERPAARFYDAKSPAVTKR